jgi:hypothetical protein
MELTSGPEAAVYAAALGVLFGLYKGDRGWGRTMCGVSFVVLIGLLLMFAPELFPEYF